MPACRLRAEPSIVAVQFFFPLYIYMRETGVDLALVVVVERITVEQQRSLRRATVRRWSEIDISVPATHPRYILYSSVGVLSGRCERGVVRVDYFPNGVRGYERVVGWLVACPIRNRKCASDAILNCELVILFTSKTKNRASVFWCGGVFTICISGAYCKVT